MLLLRGSEESCRARYGTGHECKVFAGSRPQLWTYSSHTLGSVEISGRSARSDFDGLGGDLWVLQKACQWSWPRGACRSSVHFTWAGRFRRAELPDLCGASKQSKVEAFFADLVKPVLYKRDLPNKRDWKKITRATTGQGLGPSPLEVDAGAYPPCGETFSVAGVAKYFNFDPADVACSGVVNQQSAATIAGLLAPPSFQSK